MLEKACLAVEKAATGGGVYPEVMFEVARHWHQLFEKHAPASSANDVGAEEHAAAAAAEHVSNYLIQQELYFINSVGTVELCTNMYGWNNKDSKEKLKKFT